MYRSRLSPLALAFLVVASTTIQAQVFERIDVNDQGQPGNASGFGGDISDDGRFVAFVSAATNLGGVDPASFLDAFLRDRNLGTTIRITTSLTAATAVNYCVMSGDGSTVAFSRGGTPGNPLRAYVYAVATGSITEIGSAPLSHIVVDALSYDGSYVVVMSGTTSDATSNIYRIHIPTGSTVLSSADATGAAAGGFDADIDDAGTHVTFWSNASLVAGDTSIGSDVYVHDIPGNIVFRASVGANGAQSNGAARYPSISGDGRYVAMESSATNLVPEDTNGVRDIYLRDLRLGVTTLISLSTTQGVLTQGTTSKPYISPDASSVLFASFEAIQPGDSSQTRDCFLRDLEVGSLLPASPGSATVFEDARPRSIARNGRNVLIDTQQSALGVALGQTGCFLVSFGPRCSSSGYCIALPNSTGKAASIGAQGDASRQLNNLVISAVGLPDTANAMLVSGTSAIDPGTPFGNGLLCVGGALVRHGIHVANGGVILDAQDVHSAEYSGVNPGDTRYYQVIYRDPPAGGALFNTTDAVAVTFCW